MTRLRFSLAESMAVVLLIGVWLAALRSGPVLQAIAIFTLIVVVVSTAAVMLFGVVGAVLARLIGAEDDGPDH